MQKYINNVQDLFGSAIPSVTVTIRDNPGGGLSTIFSDNGVTGKSNPFTNDTDGEFFFYAADGRYDIELTGPITETTDDILLQDTIVGLIGPNLNMRAANSTATPPTTETVSGNYNIFDFDGDDLLLSFGFNVSNEIKLRNYFHSDVGEPIRITFETSTGVERPLIGSSRVGGGRVDLFFNNELKLSSATGGIVIENFSTRAGNIVSQTGVGTKSFQIGSGAGVGPLYIEDSFNSNSVLFAQSITTPGDTISQAWHPTNGVKLYRGGFVRLNTQSDGVEIWGTVLASDPPTTEAVDGKIRFMDSDGSTLLGVVGYNTNNALILFNQMQGGDVVLQAEDAAGTTRIILTGDPDAVTVLTGDTDVTIKVAAGAETAIDCIANGKVGFRFNDVEVLRTSDNAAADIGMGAEVLHNDSSFYPVGMNVKPEIDTLDTGNLTLALANVGKMITYNSATARSLFFNDDANITVGSFWRALIGPSAGTLTGDGGTGVLIRWWNGTGWTTTAAAGDITIGVGAYTIWKETNTLYWIDGPTLAAV